MSPALVTTHVPEPARAMRDVGARIGLGVRWESTASPDKRHFSEFIAQPTARGGAS